MLIDNLVHTEVAERLGKISVSGLFYYPVKSCGGIALTSAELTTRGILHDRELMIVDSHQNFLTQRDVPQMARITPRIENGVVTLAAEGMESVSFPLVAEGAAIDVTVWDDKCRAVDQGQLSSDWLREFFAKNSKQRSYREGSYNLVRMAIGERRTLDPFFAGETKMSVDFADGFSYLVASEASLLDLNSRLPEGVGMDRFRPNIVLRGGGIPFFEDYLSRIQIGDVEIDLVKPCIRCPITQTDQSDGTKGREPLATLKKYRNFANAKGEEGPMFGQNALSRTTGIISLDSPVKVLELR